MNMDVSPVEREFERRLQEIDRLSREVARRGEQIGNRLLVMRIAMDMQEIYRLSRELARIEEQIDDRLQGMRTATGMQELVRRQREPAVAGRQFLVDTAAEVLASVPAKVYEEEEEGRGEEMCAICLSNFKVKDMYRVLPKCKHRFHQECTDKWLVQRASCPVCRAEVDLGMLARRLSAG